MKGPLAVDLKATGRSGLPYLRVGILLCPSFTLTPLASFVDSLRLAADRSDNSGQVYFAWDFISAGPAPLRASCGLEMSPTGSLERIENYDCLVVCGGLLRDLPALLTEVPQLLRAADARGIPIVGLCTGSFVLAQAGLLDDRRCALQFDTFGEFAQRFPRARPVIDENYVIDGNIITGPGSIVAIDIAMLLIEHYGNAGRARKALDYLLFKPREPRIILNRKPYQEALDSASKLTADAVQMMEFRTDSPCSIEELARLLNTSKIRLNRAFAVDMHTSPATFWRNIRLLAARELLRNNRHSITEIAYETGFSDTAHFCSCFRKHFSMTPHEFRQLRRAHGNGGGRLAWLNHLEESG